MRADRIDLFGLFNADITFVAPLFQRPYVWDREPNWEPLWEATRGVAEQHVAGATKVRPHFLGAVVLNQLHTPVGGVPVRELIDGQQRLTTLQVLLAALRDFAADRDQDNLARAFASLVENDAPLATDPRDEFKVWPTNADREAYRAAVRPSEPRSEGLDGSKILGAHAYFASRVAKWVGEGDDAPQRLRFLYEALARGLHLVAIDLDEKDGDDPQLIFETLNALGTPLLPADLVKNHLFQRVAHDEREALRLYNLYWRPFDADQDFWRADIRQGRLTRPRIDHYLKHYLSLKVREDVRMDRLFPTYKAYASESGTPAAEHLEDFHAYGDVYRRFFTAPPGSPEGLFLHRLEALDTTTVYPLLLEVFTRLGDAPSERRQILTDLESYLVRRGVVRLTTKGYNRIFLEALDQMAGDFSAATFRHFLLTREGDTSRWPDDDEFRSAWLTTPLYRSLVRRRLRMVLEAIELRSRTDKTEPLPLPAKLTVEHVLPQQWHLHWPLGRPAEGDERTRQERAADRDHALHTVGNLTLVTKKLNPSMSNGTWATKRAALRKHSALALNRELGEEGSWDEAAIARRSAALFDVARRVWPFPAGPRPARSAPAREGVEARGEEVDGPEGEGPVGEVDEAVRELGERLLQRGFALQPKRGWANEFGFPCYRFTHPAVPERGALYAAPDYLCATGTYRSLEGVVAPTDLGRGGYPYWRGPALNRLLLALGERYGLPDGVLPDGASQGSPRDDGERERAERTPASAELSEPSPTLQGLDSRSESVLRSFFEFKANAGWVALLERGGQSLAGYQTPRIAKVQDGALYFTVGQTTKGRQCGLDDRLRRIVEEEGLEVREVAATHGLDKVFVGFDLLEGGEDVLRRILTRARTAIEGCEG